MVGFILVFTPIVLVLFHFLAPATDLGKVISILYAGNGLGVLVLLSASIVAGIALNRGKNLASVKRMSLASLIYLGFLLTLEVFSLPSGVIGTQLKALFGTVSEEILLAGLALGLFYSASQIKQSAEEEDLKNFEDFQEKVSSKAEIIRTYKRNIAMREHELEVLKKRRETQKFLREPARVTSNTPRLSKRYKKEKEAPAKFEPKPWREVPVSALPDPDTITEQVSSEEINSIGEALEEAFSNYGVDVDYLESVRGPSVTRFEFEPKPGLKTSKVIKLEPEMAMALSAPSVRIEAPIPNTNRVGVEVPNEKPTPVFFKQIQSMIGESEHPLMSALGATIDGEPMFMNLADMPHLLIAGATGSGKSVGLNTMISSIIMRSNPKQVQFSMVDPKMVELTPYNGIPHLREEVITDPMKALDMVSKAVEEMESRYRLLQEYGVRHIDTYNERTGQALPYYVIVIDEFADLMEMAKTVAKEQKLKGNPLEKDLCRIAQKARAVGIHLVLATQRPSVDVVTGLLKANFPSRIAFATKSGVDSRTILDQNGAENLLGKGDMLYFPKSVKKPVRVQGLFLSEEEVSLIVNYMRREETSTVPRIKPLADM